MNSEDEAQRRLQQLREDMRNPEPLRQELIRQLAAQRKACRKGQRVEVIR